MGRGSDEDLFTGRFMKKPHVSDAPPTERSLVSTNASEEAIAQFLEGELSELFTNRQDASLFLKVLSADGIAAGAVSADPF